MWVLCLGAHISSGQKERPWFILQLAKGTQILRLQEWEDLRCLLMQFFYLDRVYQESLRMIWDEVQLLVEVIPGPCPYES